MESRKEFPAAYAPSWLPRRRPLQSRNRPAEAKQPHALSGDQLVDAPCCQP